MVTGLRSNHRVDGASGEGPDGADDIYRGHDATRKKHTRMYTETDFDIFIIIRYNDIKRCGLQRDYYNLFSPVLPGG